MTKRSTRRPVLLVVEDDDNLRVGLARLFSQCGFEVLQIHDGASFADIVSRTLLLDGGDVPAAVITDVRLPGFDGLGVVEGMRLAGWRVPVFVISALPWEDVAPRVRRMGGAEFFPKPLDLQELESAVRHAVGSACPTP